MNFKETIVAAINSEIKEREMSITILSQKTGITAVNLYRIIRGENFSMLNLSKIIRVLDLRFSLTTRDYLELIFDKEHLISTYKIAEIAFGVCKEMDNLTAKEIARRAEITEPTLSKLLSYKNVTIDVMSRLLEVLKVTTTNAK